MIQHRDRLARLRLALLPLACTVLSGCCTYSSTPVSSATINRTLTDNPVQPDQDLRPATLTATREFSMHLLQFRTGEGRHIHKSHDLTFICRSGVGEIFINDERSELTAGAVFHIPRGVPHYCRNTGPQPLVTVLVFTPPYDLKDSIPAPLPGP